MRRSTCLSVVFALLALVAAPSVRADPLADLERVGHQLLRFEKPGALFAYLRTHHPEFFALADKAGLAEVLDGKTSAADFKLALASEISSADLDDAARERVNGARASLSNILEVTPPANRVAAGALSAEAMRGLGSPAEAAEALRGSLYGADRHWISEWEASTRSEVSIRFVPGTLEWFNPNVSIPELGIRAGVPLSDGQKDALVRLLSVETTPTGANAEATAAFPAHVGRAINPNSHVLTLVNGAGEVIGDLVTKGAGANAANTGRDGRLDTSEAFLDAELSRNLARNGVRNYDVLAVIVPESASGKALLIRAPRSLLRHIDIDKLSDADLTPTLERVAREAGIRMDRDGMSVADWAREVLPAHSGENAGRLAGLGVHHGSSYGRDNHGLAETVDWGMVELGPADDGQKDTFWGAVETSLERINRLLPDAEKVDVDAARRSFDEAFERGRTAGLEGRIRFAADAVERMGEGDLRTLARRFATGGNTYSMSRDAILEVLSTSSLLEETKTVEALGRMSLPDLLAFAKTNGIATPESNDRAELVAAIVRRPVDGIRAELGLAVAARSAAGANGATRALDRTLDRTRDRVRRRGTTRRIATARR